MAVQWGLANPAGGFDYLQSLQALGNQAAQRQQLEMRDYGFRQQRQRDQARPQIQQQAASGDFAGAAAQAFSLGDYDALKYVGGLEAAKQTQLATEADTIGRLATSLIGMPADQRQAAFAAVAPQLKQAGFDDSELAAVQLDDGALQAYIKLATDTKTALASYAKSQEPINVADGTDVIRGDGTVLYRNQRDPRWQFDSESGSWLQEPGTGGGYAAPSQAMPAGGAGGPLSAMLAITAETESGNRDYLPNGQLVTSPKGAQGAMQTMPGTQRDPGFGVAPARDGSVEEKNRVGRDYLAAMMQRYGNDPAKAWAAYNAGPGRVDQAIAQRGDNWLAAMPGETRAYVAKNQRALGGGQQAGVVNVRPPKARSGNAPSGYRFNGDRLEPIPGGPADPQTATTRVVQSNRKAEGEQRKQFDALPEVKTFKKVRPQFNTLRDLARKPNPTAQDDIAMIFNYMKLLDPDSVVREGEFATAQNAAGVPDQVRNMFNRAQNGNRLNPQQRKNILGTAYQYYQRYREEYNGSAENYRSYARDAGLNPDRVARTYTPDKPKPRSSPKDKFTGLKITRVQ